MIYQVGDMVITNESPSLIPEFTNRKCLITIVHNDEVVSVIFDGEGHTRTVRVKHIAGLVTIYTTGLCRVTL